MSVWEQPTPGAQRLYSVTLDSLGKLQPLAVYVCVAALEFVKLSIWAD